MEVLFREKQTILPQEVEDALRFGAQQVVRNLPEFTEFLPAHAE